MQGLFTPIYATMGQEYILEKTFDKTDFREKHLPKGEYELCKFINCDFSNSDLASIVFIDCIFENCNLSMVGLTKTAFREIKFRNCKLLGLHFGNCNRSGMALYFENCNLSHSSFYQTILKNTSFINLKLHDVDFTESDLVGSVFENCDLTGAIFEHTNIERSDLRTSFNYSINPEINRIKRAKFSYPGVVGLLDKYDIEIDKIN